MDYIYHRCEAALAEGPYLAGGMFSLAEVALLEGKVREPAKKLP